jgi:aerobic-type carbon monoxide dehydrogenase small subunit (CoxS/CutS family)
MKTITLTVNGETVSAAVEPRTHLGDFLRNHLQLTGTHLGCEHGVCGACTVLIDGQPARSCINYAVACDGSEITTVEGFGDDPLMARLRQAFTDNHALQCGFCTPGQLVSARDLLIRFEDADEALVRKEMSANLCRCTGYMGIVNAVLEVFADKDASVLEARKRAAHPVSVAETESVSVASEASSAPRHPPPASRNRRKAGPKSRRPCRWTIQRRRSGSACRIMRWWRAACRVRRPTASRATISPAASAPHWARSPPSSTAPPPSKGTMPNGAASCGVPAAKRPAPPPPRRN